MTQAAGDAVRADAEVAPTARKTGRWTSLAFAATIAAALLLVGAFALQMRRSSAGLAVGAEAPDFTLETFDGQQVRLSDLRGRVVVLNFWASWCVPCALEAADLEAVWREYRDRDVVVLGVGYTDTRPAALAYLEEHDVTYPNGPDRQDVISRRYKLAGVPETFVIDREGRLASVAVAGSEDLAAERVVGPIAPGSAFTPSHLRQLLDTLLADTEAGA